MAPNTIMKETTLPSLKTEPMLKQPAWLSPRRITNKLKIGIIVASPRETARGDHVMALANAASPCNAVAVAMLSGDDATEWCQRHKLAPCLIVAGGGGFDQVLHNTDVDAVYITGAFENKVALIEQALRAGKHVLADDPITTSVEEHCRLINVAHACRLHLQDTTMFVYHHAVREFLQSVLAKDKFGEIRKVDACFDINPKDSRFRGVIEADGRRGCLGDLCRYCAVIGTLIFTQSNRKALSAQVLAKQLDDKGLPSHAICAINFEGGARLTVDSSYVRYAATRQSVDVHSDSHSASMSDFVFSSHSLACFRLYQKSVMNGKVVVHQGESIDVEGGPLQEVSVWIRFAELSSNAYKEGAEESSNALFNRYDFSFSAVQSQNMVGALLESLKNGCKEVKLEDLTLDIPVRK